MLAEEVMKMVWLMAAGLAAGTALLWWIRRMSKRALKATDWAGAAALFAVFAIAGESVAAAILHDTVFMTEVHRFFANPFFLIGAGYLGPFLLAKMLERK